MSDEVLGEASYGAETTVSGAGMIMDNDKSEHPMSVLFADVSGNARLHEKLGNTEALRAADRCLKRVERSVGAFGGRVVRSLGEELMAVFDTADEALQAAIEMQQRVADLPPVSGVKLAIRVGFSHGPVNNEIGRVVGETVATAAHLVGLAQPGQILTSLQARNALSPVLQPLARDLGPIEAEGTSGAERIFEVAVQDIVATAVKPLGVQTETPNDGTLGLRLYLRYAGEVLVLDDQKPVINLGRDAASDVVVHDRRASRNHVKIERQKDKIVLIDKSTNGTFVTLNGRPELFLRRSECILQGKGIICFAASASSPDADCAEFEQF